MKVFAAALDWGMGHATRMVAIIQQQIDLGHEVILGASPSQTSIYQEHFPGIQIILLDTISPIYSKRNQQIFALLKFAPKLLKSICKNEKLLKSLLKKHAFDLVISDNIYGLHNKNIKSVILTHQVNLQLPNSVKFLQTLANKLIRKQINKFDTCWIPDFDGTENLSGELSHSLPTLNCDIEYIKPISRLSITECQKMDEFPELLILISGPEKQRSIFENKVITALSNFSLRPSYLIVRGLPQINNNDLEHSVNHTTAPKLKAYIKNAKYIICRAGYSTIMDLYLLNKSALLVPTPGQSEQEYLAEYLQEKKLFLSMKQNQFDIQSAIQKLKVFTPDFGSFNRSKQPIK